MREKASRSRQLRGLRGGPVNGCPSFPGCATSLKHNHGRGASGRLAAACPHSIKAASEASVTVRTWRSERVLAGFLVLAQQKLAFPIRRPRRHAIAARQ